MNPGVQAALPDQGGLIVRPAVQGELLGRFAVHVALHTTLAI